MEINKIDERIEREAIGTEFSTSMRQRNNVNHRRGGIIIDQASIIYTMEHNSFKGLDIEPPMNDEIVTDSESEDD